MLCWLAANNEAFSTTQWRIKVPEDFFAFVCFLFRASFEKVALLFYKVWWSLKALSLELPSQDLCALESSFHISATELLRLLSRSGWACLPGVQSWADRFAVLKRTLPNPAWLSASGHCPLAMHSFLAVSAMFCASCMKGQWLVQGHTARKGAKPVLTGLSPSNTCWDEILRALWQPVLDMRNVSLSPFYSFCAHKCWVLSTEAMPDILVHYLNPQM